MPSSLFFVSRINGKLQCGTFLQMKGKYIYIYYIIYVYDNAYWHALYISYIDICCEYKGEVWK